MPPLSLKAPSVNGIRCSSKLLPGYTAYLPNEKCASRPASPVPPPGQCLTIAFTLFVPHAPSRASLPFEVWKPSVYARAISAESFEPSPKVIIARRQRGSVARSICGERAVAIPKARYSVEATSPKRNTNAGSKVAAKPRVPGQAEIRPPTPAANSSSAITPWRGSDELLAGIPWSRPSHNACTLLFHCAVTYGLFTFEIRMWRTLSSMRNFNCWSVKSEGEAYDLL